MLRSIAALFANRVFIRSTSLISSILLARLLGPELQGQASFLVMMGMLLFTVSVLGMDTSAIFYVRRKGVTQGQFFWRTLPYIFAASVCTTIVFLALSRSVLSSAFQQYGNILLLLTCAFALLEGVFTLLAALLMARECVRYYNRVTALKAACLMLLMLLALLFQWRDLMLVLVFYCLSSVVAVSLCFYYLRPSSSKHDSLRMRDVLSFSVFPWMSNLLTLVSLRIDAVMLSVFIVKSEKVAPEDLGLYTICILAVGAAREFQNAIQTAFFPHVAGQEKTEAALTTGRVYKGSFFIFLLVYAAIWAFGYPALMLFGPEYTRAYPTLLLLAFGSVLIRGNMGSLSLYLTSFDRPAYPVVSNVVSVVSNILLNLVLLPRYGIAGAALATTISILLSKTLLVFLFCRETNSSYVQDLLATRGDLQQYWIAGKQYIRSKLPGG